VAQTGRRIARSCQILTTLVCGFGALLAGCDECPGGASRCVGDTYGACYVADDAIARWHDTACPVACHVANGKAACVSSRTPVPECGGRSDPLCVDGVPTRCHDGYPITLPACDFRTHCVVSTECADALCAIDDKVPANCSFEPSCDGSLLTTCQCGFVVARDDCGAADLCRKVGSRSRCTATAAPDPRCGDPTKISSSFCDGDNAVECEYGYTYGRWECGRASLVCRETNGVADCDEASAKP